MATPDDAIGARSALAEATEKLTQLVVDESDPGAQLPGEAELADRFEVSRLTIREAIRHLEGQGLVHVAKGKRPVVATPSSAVLANYFAVALRRDPRGLIELNEVRLSLEVLSATLAATAATAATIVPMATAIERMHAAARAVETAGRTPAQLDDYFRADVDFHSAIALASGNRMLALLLESLGDCLHESFSASTDGHFMRGGTMNDVVETHRGILDAIVAHDVKRAEHAMRTHLEDAQRDLRAAMRVAPFTTTVKETQ